VILLGGAAAVVVTAGCLSQYRVLKRLGQLEVQLGAVHAPSRVTARPEIRTLEVPLPTEPVALSGAAVRGHANARIGVIEYADFECPYCAEFMRETFPALKHEYVDTGRVLWAFRHFPLPGHASAVRLAEVAECAHHQRRFWQLHDALLRHPEPVTPTALITVAKLSGVDVTAEDNCDSQPLRAAVSDDAADARRLGVASTPTFLIGRITVDHRLAVRRSVVGAQPFAEFSRVLDEVLAKDK
jgi:protein-disulfide isomerase